MIASKTMRGCDGMGWDGMGCLGERDGEGRLNGPCLALPSTIQEGWGAAFASPGAVCSDTKHGLFRTRPWPSAAEVTKQEPDPIICGGGCPTSHLLYTGILYYEAIGVAPYIHFVSGSCRSNSRLRSTETIAIPRILQIRTRGRGTVA